MITDLTQLQVALHQLTAFEDMLAAMRRHLEETHPPLVPLMSEGYLERIHTLQTEILTYLRERPTDVPLHAKTVRGKLIAINVEENTCTIHPENAAPVECAYEEALEDHLIAALRQEVEVAGQFIPLEWLSRRYRITRMQRTGLLRQEDTVEASG